MAKYDLGNGVSGETTLWAPDRELNPMYADVPDIDPFGLIITFADGCMCIIEFDLPEIREVNPHTDKWAVQSWEPLDLGTSSVMRQGVKNCRELDHTNCQHHNHHGYIQRGQWVPCGDDGIVMGSG